MHIRLARNFSIFRACGAQPSGEYLVPGVGVGEREGEMREKPCPGQLVSRARRDPVPGTRTAYQGWAGLG